jgi:hypothetical protein
MNYQLIEVTTLKGKEWQINQGDNHFPLGIYTTKEQAENRFDELVFADQNPPEKILKEYKDGKVIVNTES